MAASKKKVTKKKTQKKVTKKPAVQKAAATPPRLIVSLPEEVRLKLEKLAQREGRSMAKVICRLIEGAA